MALIRVSNRLIKTETITSNNITDGSITGNKIAVDAGGTPASVNLTIQYINGIAAANNESVTIDGGPFTSSSVVYVSNIASPITTVANTTQLSFVAPDLPSGTHIGYIVSPDGKMSLFRLNYA